MSGLIGFAEFASLVDHLADLLEPLCHTSATAAAIVLFTACVRLLVHPLSRAAARGQKARVLLAPRVAELRARHAKNPERLRAELVALYAAERVSPFAGCLPSLLQIPAFFLLYQLFSRSGIDGEPNALLTHTLFTAPLGDRFCDALGAGGPLGERGLVYLALFAVVATVATFNYRQTRRGMAATAATAAPAGSQPPAGSDTPAVPGMAGIMKVAPLMSFVTLVTVAVAPLAAALYMVTSTTWSAVERAVLYRDMPVAGGGTGRPGGPTARPAGSG